MTSEWMAAAIMDEWAAQSLPRAKERDVAATCPYCGGPLAVVNERVQPCPACGHLSTPERRQLELLREIRDSVRDLVTLVRLR